MDKNLQTVFKHLLMSLAKTEHRGTASSGVNIPIGFKKTKYVCRILHTVLKTRGKIWSITC